MSSALGILESRFCLVDDEIGRFMAALGRAVETYEWALRVEAQRSAQGAPVVARELDRFHRSLNRTSSVRAAAKHWNELSSEGRTFIEMRLRMAEPPRTGFSGLDLSDPADFTTLRDAVGAARRWLGEKPGTEHSASTRALVREVDRVYRRATGKEPGLSSLQATAGPSYTTPFEALLLAVLAEAGTPLSVEAARSLYREELRNKSQKVWLEEELGQ